MKYLITTIAAVVLVGCGEPPKGIWEAALEGNIESAKQHIASGTNVNMANDKGVTSLHNAAYEGHFEIAELLIVKEVRM